MKRSDAFPSKFLSKDDVKAPTLCTIEKVVNETLGQGEDQEVKPVMYFSSGVSKPMVINNTNWMSVEDLYGDESDDWPGKAIEVWVDPSVSFGGKRIGGLRLRQPVKVSQPVPAGSNGGNGSSSLATGEQWEQWFAIAGKLDALGQACVEPPGTTTYPEMVKELAKLKAKLPETKTDPTKALRELGYPEEPPVDSPDKRRSFPGAWVKALIEAKLAENSFDAAGMLAKSNLAEDAPVEKALAWGRLYRGWRSLDKKPDEAAALANDGKAPQ